jgi:hypothetical protein
MERGSNGGTSSHATEPRMLLKTQLKLSSALPERRPRSLVSRYQYRSRAPGPVPTQASAPVLVFYASLARAPLSCSIPGAATP